MGNISKWKAVKLIYGLKSTQPNQVFLHLRECHVDIKKVVDRKIVSHQMHIYQSKIDFFMWVCDDEDGLFTEIEHNKYENDNPISSISNFSVNILYDIAIRCRLINVKKPFIVIFHSSYFHSFYSHAYASSHSLSYAVYGPTLFFIFTYDYASYFLSRISSENFFPPFLLFNKKECYSK